ncbi:thioesterase II family protein [Actinomadura oligospora]|uniref:thioesterase II family protein n=1 Tax=Actinomadura oligospora TaxID=111804 RepID=UPI00047BFFDF|nr:alpha/beta fold hydrolase [Actinomadura oligospora]
MGLSWIRAFRPRPAARLRLICFPNAGGAASAFRDWPDLLPPSVELLAVQYPGRQDRYAEPLVRDLTAMADAIAEEVMAVLDRPAALFGHSMGAIVAFETARRVRPRYPSPLAHLFASACKAPDARVPTGLRFDDEEVRAFIHRLGGSGAAPLADEGLWRLTLPMLRSDFLMADDYRYTPGAPLTCPITAIAGDADTTFTASDAPRWAAHTVGGFEARTLPGGHFYNEDVPGDLVALLLERLRGDLDGSDERVEARDA